MIALALAALQLLLLLLFFSLPFEEVFLFARYQLPFFPPPLLFIPLLWPRLEINASL